MENPQYYTEEEVDALLVGLGNRPYEVYTALISQSGVNDPTVVVLENTLGGTVVWTRASEGFYFATLNGAFLSGKTTSFVQANSLTPIGSFVVGYLTARWSNDSVFINTYRLTTTATALSQDSLLTNVPIEIRIYN